MDKSSEGNDREVVENRKSNMALSAASTVATSTGDGVQQLNGRHFPNKIEDSSENNSDKGGNNSDGTSNSAIAGLSTNDYFGFNFEEDQNFEGGGAKVSAGNSHCDGDVGVRNKRSPEAPQKVEYGHLTADSGDVSGNGPHSNLKLGEQSNDVSMVPQNNKPSHEAAAAAAVANLQSIANESVQSSFNTGGVSDGK